MSGGCDPDGSQNKKSRDQISPRLLDLFQLRIRVSDDGHQCGAVSKIEAHGLVTRYPGEKRKKKKEGAVGCSRPIFSMTGLHEFHDPYHFSSLESRIERNTGQGCRCGAIPGRTLANLLFKGLHVMTALMIVV